MMGKWLWFVLMPVLCVVVVAQSPGSSVEECTSVLMEMADCLAFVEKGSAVAKPSASCCGEFKKVLRNNPQCLCLAFSNRESFPIPIDMNKAMSLPLLCKAATGYLPCSISGTNGPSPAPSPSESIPSPAQRESQLPPQEQPTPAPISTVAHASPPSRVEDVNHAPPHALSAAKSLLSKTTILVAILALVGFDI